MINEKEYINSMIIKPVRGTNIGSLISPLINKYGLEAVIEENDQIRSDIYNAYLERSAEVFSKEKVEFRKTITSGDEVCRTAKADKVCKALCGFLKIIEKEKTMGEQQVGIYLREFLMNNTGVMKWVNKISSFCSERGIEIKTHISSYNFCVFHCDYSREITRNLSWLRTKNYKFKNGFKKTVKCCVGIWGPIPYLTKNNFCFIARRENAKQKAPFLWARNVDDIFHLFGSREGAVLVERLAVNFSSISELDLTTHDYNMWLERVLDKNLTKAGIRWLLNRFIEKNKGDFSNEITYWIKSFHRVYSYVNDNKKFSGYIRRLAKNPNFFKEKISEIEAEETKKLIKKSRLNEEGLEKLNTLLEECKKYSDVTVPAFIHKFGSSTNRVVRGNVSCVFKAKEYATEYKNFCEKLCDYMHDRSRAGKKLYSYLIKNDLLERVRTGNLRAAEYSEIKVKLDYLNINLKAAPITAKIEKKCSSGFLMAGNATVCCMSFEDYKSTDYALLNEIGIFNVYYKNRIIANSVLWMDKDLNALVLDNIEVHPNYEKFNSDIAAQYQKMISDIMEQYNLTACVQGECYNDLDLFDKEAKIVKTTAHCIGSESEISEFYSDARRAHIVCGSVAEEYIYQPPVRSNNNHWEETDDWLW